MSADVLPIATASALLSTGVRLHHRTAGEGDDVVVLLHGWPQTSWQWRHVIPLLARAGLRVVAPDARGTGRSSWPRRGDAAPHPHEEGLSRTGWDQWTAAEDVHALLTEELGVTGPVTLVGHDLGAMTAVAYALRYRGGLRALAFGEAPVPGTQGYERLKTVPPMYHFSFDDQVGLPGTLVTDREEASLQHLVDRLGYAPETVDTAHYARAYRRSGAPRTGLDLYRALETDAEDNRHALERDGRLDVPVLAFSGEVSRYSDVIGDMARELADDVRVAEIPRTGHWMAEENPRVLARVLLDFLADVSAPAGA